MTECLNRLNVNPLNFSLQADVERDFAADKFGLKTFPTLVLLPKNGKSGERGIPVLVLVPTALWVLLGSGSC